MKLPLECGALSKKLNLRFIPMSVIIDTLSALNGAYVIPESVFPFRIFGVSTVELYPFAFLWVLMGELFCEQFFDHGRSGDRISPRIRISLYIVFGISAVIVTLLFADRRWLLIP